MKRYERLDKDGNVVEVRQFPASSPPSPIPHKGVSWREVAIPPRRDTGKAREVEIYRQKIRLDIIDALPDLEKIAAIRSESDKRISELLSEV